MVPHELPVRDAEDVWNVLRALGSHRYVRSRLILVHAAAITAANGSSGSQQDLREASDWASALLEAGDVDPASRDERLWRRSTEAEAGAVLRAFWGAERAAVHAHLREWLRRFELPEDDADPFDDAHEEEIHPLLVDAGWELLSLGELDEERHRGAMAAFGEPILFESAKFEEESALTKAVYLQELAAFGSAELLRGVDAQGLLTSPIALWTEGSETYHDYVLRGVVRAARLG